MTRAEVLINVTRNSVLAQVTNSPNESQVDTMVTNSLAWEVLRLKELLKGVQNER